MGIVVALFLLLFAVTGILINHSTDLKLTERYVTWPWLMKHYGIGDVEADAVYLIEDKVFSQFDTQVFIDDSPLTHIQRPLLGGILLEDVLVLATDDALLLLTPEGEFIERLGAEAGTPAEIQNIGLFRGEPVLQTKNGMWRSNFMLDQWEPIQLDGVSWSHPFPMPNSVRQSLSTYFYGQGISVQQLLIDLHNGRILGHFGVWLMDLAAGILIFLALTGIWMWGRRR
jgi:hypothetical protein